ncbi:MAG TPA: SprT-like domain-containing protein, partial [Arachidicoccus soli]|nr:SprT-like domain-containing protein [Arachidicoccus soli]
MIILFFNLIPMLKEGKLGLAGPQSVLADFYGDENGNYDGLYDSLSDLYGFDIVGSHYNTNGELAFDLSDGGLFYPNSSMMDEVVITSQVVDAITDPFPDFEPEDPLAEPEVIFIEFLEWYEDHTAQIPDANSNAVNNITDDCLKALVQSVINGDSETNPFSNILKTTFGTSSDINITFIQYNGTNETHIDGRTGGSQYHLEIKLNLAALDYSSNENVTATIYHEIIHAYLRTIGVNGESTQHDIIANGWREAMSDQLQEDYPNLSPTDADALAWG